jgi:hypothetical protein
MFQSFFISIQVKIHSLWTFIIRKKRKMENTISLNVLVIPPALNGASTGAESAKVITKHNILVLEISPNSSVYQLKPND